MATPGDGGIAAGGERDLLRVRRRRATEAGEHDVKVTLVQRHHQLAVLAAKLGNLKPWSFAYEARHRPHQHLAASAGGAADGKPAAPGAAQRLDLMQGVLVLRRHDAGMTGERQAEHGWGDAAGAAFDQPGAHLGLQLGEALAQRRGGNVHRRGGAAQVAVLDNGGKVAKLAQVHGPA